MTSSKKQINHLFECSNKSRSGLNSIDKVTASFTVVFNAVLNILEHC